MTRTKTLTEVVRELREVYEQLGSWQAVADKYGVTKPLAWRTALRGYEPKDNDIRSRLGLPVIVEKPQLRGGDGRYVSKVG